MRQKKIKIGTRSSALAINQANETAGILSSIIPNFCLEIIPMSSPGDHDQDTYLEDSVSDFFTRYLDEAVKNRVIDCAIHSAKDIPVPLPHFMEWFWLPQTRDKRDVLVLRKGESFNDLPSNFTIGISSRRREVYSKKHFPHAVLRKIRGNITKRLSLLDDGTYDLLIMAGVALQRLNLEDRISSWIPLAELEPPSGQGHLAITYHKEHQFFHRLRSFFIKPAVFLGGGSGSAMNCTQGGILALRHCDVCLYDSLAPQELPFQECKKNALLIDVGKRQGKYSISREKLDQMMTDYIRQGKFVVRLKGGDPGIYGRLAEEISNLDSHCLPYHIIPGISSFLSATTGNGFLLTKRGVSQGFIITTPRFTGTSKKCTDLQSYQQSPMIFFMAVGKVHEIVAGLLAKGRSDDEPATMFYGAGSDNQKIVSGSLVNIGDKVDKVKTSLPGILVIGSSVLSSFSRYYWSALQGKRVLITCSRELQEGAKKTILRYGGIPICRPLIQLVPNKKNTQEILTSIKNYHWITLTSPASVKIFFALLQELNIDIRTIPKVMVSGVKTAEKLKRYGLCADLTPTKHFGSFPLLEAAQGHIISGDRILRLRSDQSDDSLKKGLENLGASVTDCILYRNTPVLYQDLPEYDAVLFASSSSWNSFYDQWGREILQDKISLAIGNPTKQAMHKKGYEPTITAPQETISASIQGLALHSIKQSLQSDF